MVFLHSKTNRDTIIVESGFDLIAQSGCPNSICSKLVCHDPNRPKLPPDKIEESLSFL